MKKSEVLQAIDTYVASELESLKHYEADNVLSAQMLTKHFISALEDIRNYVEHLND